MSLSPLKQALLALEEMEAKLEAQQAAARQPLAVVGLACRLPGASTPEELWRLLCHGVDAVGDVPAERWDAEAHYDADPEAPGKMSTRWGGFLRDIDHFDADFFGISPREAERMDPQQRLFLEVAWEALEDTGLVARSLAGSRTGVFVGFCFSDYSRALLADPQAIDAYTSTGGAHSIIANRLSYFLDLRGPSVAVDTACSSSLVAIHLACQSLRGGESDLAFAGGVNLILDPPWTISFTKFGMMSADGRCKTFDTRADGFVRGEGCGVLVMKRLADAERDGDRILAVIRGTAVNQDGRTNGLTAPNGLSQAAVLRAALDNAGVEPGAVRYVETHGTGTKLGDPIEVEALKEVYGEPREGDDWCALGALKTNLGHLEAAAGIAGLIKAVLTVERGTVVPNLHFQELNPGISLGGTRFVLPAECLAWSDSRRFGAVSSFGFGGTNAHVVLQSAPPQQETPREVSDKRCHLLPLSARAPEALRDLAGSYRDLLRRQDGAPHLGDLCATASLHRSHHSHRLAIVGGSPEELAERLEAFRRGETPPGSALGERASGTPPGLVFVFPGQGSQWSGMGRRLLRRSASFQQAVEACDQAIRAEAGWSPLAELTGEKTSSEVDVVQPTLFAVQVGLAAQWRAWGIVPDAVVGHSMGEVAAAHVAGALSLDDAVRIICRRSRLLRRVSGQGEMALVELSFEAACEVLEGYEDRLSVAASNSPRSTVLSGEPRAMDEVLARLAARDVFCRRIKVDVASHSPAMDPLRGDLLAALADLRPRAATLPMVSTVTTEFLEGHELDADYWVRNLRRPVRLHAATGKLLAEGHRLFVEISPHPILLPAIDQGLGRGGSALASLRRGEDEESVLLETLGGLYARGYPIDWRRLHPGPFRQLRLPLYPWQRERFWFDVDADSGRRRPGRGAGHPLLAEHLRPARQPQMHCFQVELDDEVFAYLRDHEVHGQRVVPGTLLIEMVLAGAREALGAEPRALTDVRFNEAFLLPREGRRSLQLALVSGRDGSASVELFGLPAGEASAHVDWTRYGSGRLVSAPAGERERGTPAEIRTRLGEQIDGGAYYTWLREQGLACGPAFQAVERLWRGEGEALGRLSVPEEIAGQAALYLWHPALLEAAFQVLAAAVPRQDGSSALRLSSHVARLHVYAPPDGARGALWSHGRLTVPDSLEEGSPLEGELTVYDDEGRVLLRASGILLSPLTGGAELLAILARRQLGAADANDTVRQSLLAADTGNERRAVLESHLREELGRVLKLSPERIATGRQFQSFGIDSVMALKLRGRLEESLGLTLSATLVWNYPTLEGLTAFLAEQIGIEIGTAPAGSGAHPAAGNGAGTGSPEGPVEDVLAQELEEIDALLEGK